MKREREREMMKVQDVGSEVQHVSGTRENEKREGEREIEDELFDRW